MTYIVVHCYNCGAKYHLYYDSDPIQNCPHCMAEMPKRAFTKIRNALYTFEEINKNFRQANEDRGTPLFQIEIKNHYVPLDKYRC